MELDYRDLIIKFFAEEISDEELDLLKSWLSKSDGNRKIFDQENELWHISDKKTKLEHFNTGNVWNAISSKYKFGNKLRKVTVVRKTTINLLVAAACVGLLIISGSLVALINTRQSFHQATVTSTLVSTNCGDNARIFLPDSTEVILNSGSKLQYDGGYDIKDRVVRLHGEAFFDVRTNPDKPFVVKVDKMDVTATGTRFNVLSYDNENRIEATLEEGVIKVNIAGKEPISLNPGQQVVYSKKSEKAEIQNVNTYTYTNWMENKLQLQDTPFEEALRKIGRKYNVTFEVTNKGLLDLKYTATFIDESIEDVMAMLKIVSPINYKIEYRASVNDKQYVKPKIIVGPKRTVK